MATQIITTNRFHNVTPEMLADIIGKLDREAKAINSELDAAKDAFKASGLQVAEGGLFSVMVQKSIRQTLDTAKVKSTMGQQWFDDNSRLGEVSSLRISASATVAA